MSQPNAYDAFIGMDVHKDSIALAIADPERGSEVRFYGYIANDTHAVDRLFKKLGKKYPLLLTCYEAGPCGYRLFRQLTNDDIECQVVAPSRIPKSPTDRIKNDHRDAMSLARLLRSDELTPVWAPDESHEAMRDLVRARTASKKDTKIARQRIQSLLLPDWSLGDLVIQLQALRGVALIVSVTVVAEVGDFARFTNPKQLMAYLGMIPGEHSSGGKTRGSGITKVGNKEARRVLYEAAWSYRSNAKVGQWMLRHTPEGVTQASKDISWKAQQRLCFRYRSLVAKRKKSQVAITAVARELPGFMWDISRTLDQNR